MKYIVMEVGYEYNDETYDRSEGGTPLLVYDTLADAIKNRDAREKDHRKYMDDDDLRAYCGCHNDNCTHPDLKFFYVQPVKEAGASRKDNG